nr:MAG TPA: hypothetical protein [Caudoviricetes sp.]
MVEPFAPCEWLASSPVDRKELIYCRLILLTLQKQ